MQTAALIIGICWLVFVIYWLISAMSAKRTIRSGNWWAWTLGRLLIIVAVVWYAEGVNANFARVPLTTNPLLAGLGALLVILGIALAVWARVYLGRNGGMPMSVKESPELVTGGPYAYIRHPIYSGILLATLGSALGASAAWLAFFVVFFFYFLYSAQAEERRMAELFPEQYLLYKRRTKMLIPFVL